MDIHLSEDVSFAAGETDHDQIQLDLETPRDNTRDLADFLLSRGDSNNTEITSAIKENNEEFDIGLDFPDGCCFRDVEILDHSVEKAEPEAFLSCDLTSSKDIYSQQPVHFGNDIDWLNDEKTADVIVESEPCTVTENITEEDSLPVAGEQCNNSGMSHSAEPLSALTTEDEVLQPKLSGLPAVHSPASKTDIQSDMSEKMDTGPAVSIKETPSVASSIAISGDVSLDNITLEDPAEPPNSDDEFDFDLPTISTMAPTGRDTQKVCTKAPAQDQSSELALKGVSVQKIPGTQPTITSLAEPVPVVNSLVQPTPVPTANVPQPNAASMITTQKPVAVIKPSTQTELQAHTFPAPQVLVDRGADDVLSAAQDEWENVTTIQAGVEPTVVKTVKAMSPYEMSQIIQQEDFSAVRGSIKTHVEHRGFAAFVNLLFGPPKLHKPLHEERNRVFCIAATQLCNENSSHMRTLQTIYRCLTGSKFDCPRVGAHWEEIGFQGNDPATDLRGAGMLALVNLLYILKDPRTQQLASDIYKLSLHPSQNFPFCVMGINLSRIALQTLREDLLNKECNRRGEVISVVNEFFAGLYMQMYRIWKTQGKTISHSGYVLKEIELEAKKNVRGVFRQLEEFVNRKKPTLDIDHTETFGPDNFTNVCED